MGVADREPQGDVAAGARAPVIILWVAQHPDSAEGKGRCPNPKDENLAHPAQCHCLDQPV